MNTVTRRNRQSNSCRCLPGSLWRGDQDAPELLKSRGSREKTRTRVKRFTVVCERSETITSVRNVPGRNKRGQALQIPDADQVKHRLSVATLQNDEQGNCCPSGNRYQRQTDGSRIANERDWQKWWRHAGIVRRLSGMSDHKKGSPEQ